jgi:hypothetical protein
MRTCNGLSGRHTRLHSSKQAKQNMLLLLFTRAHMRICNGLSGRDTWLRRSKQTKQDMRLLVITRAQMLM